MDRHAEQTLIEELEAKVAEKRKAIKEYDDHLDNLGDDLKRNRLEAIDRLYARLSIEPEYPRKREIRGKTKDVATDTKEEVRLERLITFIDDLVSANPKTAEDLKKSDGLERRRRRDEAEKSRLETKARKDETKTNQRNDESESTDKAKGSTSDDPNPGEDGSSYESGSQEAQQGLVGAGSHR